MKTRFCSNCGYELSDGNQCKQQENQDGRVIHKCKNCGKQVEYKPTENNVYECMVEENQWHRINLGRLGYGSCMDGDVINFEICDECLYKAIKGIL